MAHAVTKSCSAGELPDCACTKSKHRYHGNRVKARCDENIQYGLMFSELFVDAPVQDKKARMKFRRNGQNLVNLHNSRAGRKVFLFNIKNELKKFDFEMLSIKFTVHFVLLSFFNIQSLQWNFDISLIHSIKFLNLKPPGLMNSLFLIIINSCAVNGLNSSF